MSIKIKKITTHISEHHLRKERIIVSNIGIHDCSRFLTVTLHSDNGLKGFGEAATTPIWSGEAAETAQFMVEKVFAPKLENHTFDHPREVISIMDELVVGNPFAKASVDTAFWDLWARSQDVRVTHFFADREPVSSIPTRVSIGAYGVKETVSLACVFWEMGIRTLKFKVGVPPFDDVARLRAVREQLGEAPIFTIDPNGGYPTADEAVAAIEKLLPYNLHLVEQPTPRDRMQMLADVRRRIPVPILADEAVFTPGDLQEALDYDAFDILSVYPGKNAGLTHTLDMVKIARQAGKTCAIGSNLESDLGQAAMACLAAGLEAFPVEKIACDLGSSLYYEQSSVNRPLALKKGRIEVPVGLGFGVEPL